MKGNVQSSQKIRRGGENTRRCKSVIPFESRILPTLDLFTLRVHPLSDPRALLHLCCNSASSLLSSVGFSLSLSFHSSCALDFSVSCLSVWKSFSHAYLSLPGKFLLAIQDSSGKSCLLWSHRDAVHHIRPICYIVLQILIPPVIIITLHGNSWFYYLPPY